MPNRILVTALVLLGMTSTATAAKHHRARPALGLQASATPSSNDGAKIDSSTGTVFAVAPPVKVSATFVEFHSARVENDLMLFRPTLIGIAPIGRGRPRSCLPQRPTRSHSGF
jgi:hypothetical protein